MKYKPKIIMALFMVYTLFFNTNIYSEDKEESPELINLEVGSIIGLYELCGVGELKGFKATSIVGINHDYYIFRNLSCLPSIGYDFWIIKVVARPDPITVDSNNMYDDDYEIVYKDKACLDISACASNVISYLNTADSMVRLVTVKLWPSVIVDTLLMWNINSFQKMLLDDNSNTTGRILFRDGDIKGTLVKRDNGCDYVVRDNGVSVDTFILSPELYWLNPRFDYRLSLLDSVFAVGFDVEGQNQIDIYKIGQDNNMREIAYIVGGEDICMSYDYGQILCVTRYSDEKFKDSGRGEIVIYDIPTGKMESIGSGIYSYSNPKRYRRNDYVYCLRDDGQYRCLCRISSNKEEVLFDEALAEHFIVFYRLNERGDVYVMLCLNGRDPKDMENLSYRLLVKSDRDNK